MLGVVGVHPKVKRHVEDECRMLSTRPVAAQETMLQWFRVWYNKVCETRVMLLDLKALHINSYTSISRILMKVLVCGQVWSTTLIRT